jgi:hypothetical protein
LRLQNYFYFSNTRFKILKTKTMLRKLSLLTAMLLTVLYVQAQGFKFGVHVDPLVSFMASNDKKVVPKGAQMGFGLGVEMEYYFSDKENYAFTFGGNFALGKGGKLTYNDGGRLLSNSELDNTVYFNNQTNQSASSTQTSGLDLALVPGTTIRYNINYLEIPFGLKLRTNELGQSYLRAFFHIPTVTVGIPVSARGNVEAPRPGTTLTAGFYTPEISKGENVYKDITFLQLSLGTGAGVEWSPNDEGGLRLVGGFYYNYGFIDTVKKNYLYDNTLASPTPTKESKARTGFHNIGLRVGIIF